jgi:hypothetical protein
LEWGFQGLLKIAVKDEQRNYVDIVQARSIEEELNGTYTVMLN